MILSTVRINFLSCPYLFESFQRSFSCLSSNWSLCAVSILMDCMSHGPNYLWFEFNGFLLVFGFIIIICVGIVTITVIFYEPFTKQSADCYWTLFWFDLKKLEIFFCFICEEIYFWPCSWEVFHTVNQFLIFIEI